VIFPHGSTSGKPTLLSLLLLLLILLLLLLLQSLVYVIIELKSIIVENGLERGKIDETDSVKSHT